MKQGQARASVRNVYPEIEGGRFAIKRVVGEAVNLWADVFADGHDIVNAAVQYRERGKRKWQEQPAEAIGNDRWHMIFTPEEMGFYEYKIIGWIDQALSWSHGIRKKAEAGIHVQLELQEGLEFAEHLKKEARGDDKQFMKHVIKCFSNEDSYEEAVNLALSQRLSDLMHQHPFRPFIYESQVYSLKVDREKARFSTWYEFFPRSSSPKEGAHGTFKDCIKLLPRVAEMGFDTLYFPPVHPIGREFRKGKNNAETAAKGDVGSCWGIGAKEGGHVDLHPKLGSLKDFKSLVVQAKEQGIEIAMDFALQAAPDHPWVKDHPEWFKARPDGSIQYAENPPKKYQDIYPIWFETPDWKNLWKAMLETCEYWIEQGVTTFRVDNPHTKPFGFWEYLIGEVHKTRPEVIFLSEAFTRPRVMEELAKVGFTQSYTYYTWRNSKEEIREYMNELTNGLVSEYFRPNFWPNTPDILPWSLQRSSSPGYRMRYFLAATLSSNVGVYGPVYEFMTSEAVPGKEEYLNSEKYEVRHWDWEKRNEITDLFTKINTLRGQLPALQQTNDIQFFETTHPDLIAFVKRSDAGKSVLVLANLNPEQEIQGELMMPHWEMNAGDHFTVYDHMTDASYQWHGDRHFIALHPDQPYHLFTAE